MMVLVIIVVLGDSKEQQEGEDGVISENQIITAKLSAKNGVAKVVVVVV